MTTNFSVGDIVYFKSSVSTSSHYTTRGGTMPAHTGPFISCNFEPGDKYIITTVGSSYMVITNPINNTSHYIYGRSGIDVISKCWISQEEYRQQQLSKIGI